MIMTIQMNTLPAWRQTIKTDIIIISLKMSTSHIEIEVILIVKLSKIRQVILYKSEVRPKSILYFNTFVLVQMAEKERG
jgi:hypothetical protein